MIATVLAWGVNFPALKVLYLDVAAPAVGLLRYVITLAIMAVVCVLARESLRYDREVAGRVLFIGFLAHGVYMVLFLEGMRLCTPADAAILLAVAPIFTYLLSVLYRHEAFSVIALLGSLLAFVGVGAVVGFGTRQGQSSIGGYALIIAAAALWAWSVVLSKPFLKHYSPMRLFTLSMPGALPVMLVYGTVALLRTDWRGVEPISWLALAHISLIAGALGFTGFYAGVRDVGATGAMLYQFLVPPVAAVAAWWLLGTPLQPIQGVGFVLIVIGICVSESARRALTPETSSA
jgi:drug/metabolite transporter (DMT)-like permease